MTTIHISKAGRIAGLVLRISFLTLILSFGATILGFSTGSWWIGQVTYFVCGVALLVTLAAGLVRIGISIFAESQMRLSEILLTVFASATVASILSAWIGYSGGIHDKNQTLGLRIGAFIVTLLLFGTGASWAWSAARRMGEHRAGERIKTLVCGWLLAVGGASFAILFVAGLILVLEMIFLGFHHRDREFVKFVLICGLISLLAVPGVNIEYKIRNNRF